MLVITLIHYVFISAVSSLSIFSNMHHLFSKFDNCNSLNSEHPEQPILSEQSEHRKAWKHCLKSPKNQNYQIRIMQPYSLHILI